MCPLLGTGLEPSCYSRNADVGGTLIFQPAALVMYIISLGMAAIMIYHIKSKYTAVGRKEIVHFFYCYMLTIFIEFLLVSGIVGAANGAYPIMTAIHIGLINTTFWMLLVNGFVAFQWIEDGTPLSLWSLRISSLVVLALSIIIAFGTFQNWSFLDKNDPTVLFIVFFVFNGIILAIYVVSQVLLVFRTLDNRWPLGDLFFGVLFFVCGQIFVGVFSTSLCNAAKHYIDGMFFGVTFTLLSVMMVYKYWDSITKEDLEFVVPTNRMSLVDLQEPLMKDQKNTQYGSDAIRPNY